jgi:tetratricopeptide (TPR) repeat protein
MSCTIKKTKTFVAITIFIVASCVIGAYAYDDVALNAQAEELYLKNDFARAYELYQRISEKTPSVYYNLGNCAYKMDKFGYALLYWRRAERDWGLFGRDVLVKNIDLIKQKTSTAQQKELVELPYPKVILNFLTTIQQTLLSMVKAIPLFHLQLIVLILWVILFLYMRMFGKRKQMALICVLFGFLAISAWMLALKYSFQHQKRLVVLYKNTPLLSGPGTNFAPKGHLPEAQEADILKESGEFYRIRVNKHTGWIDKQFVEKV